MFHQIRVDVGREFFLSLGIQEQLSHLRNKQELLPYRQTESKRVSTTLFAVYLLLRSHRTSAGDACSILLAMLDAFQ